MMRTHLLTAGTVLGGDFTVMHPLDRGGMGAVYVVSQRSTEKLRALKVMHSEIAADPALARRFEQEARVGARIDSEHVVEVIAAGTDAALGAPYLVMELLEGEDLRRRMHERGPMGAGTVRAVFEQLCHAMAAAHLAGVVHRDLKPENIFLAKSRRAGDAPFVLKVLDFGISKLVQEAQTRATHGTIGSPLWMAPEQTATGPVTAAADTWALGLIAYHLFTGSYFWRAAKSGTTIQLLREIVFEPISSASARAREEGLAERLPPAFDLWFERCVARDPGARFPDAKSLWEAMRVLLATPDAMAETLAARPLAVPAPPRFALETRDAIPYPAPRPSPPPRDVSKETPISTAQVTPLPTPPPRPRSPVVLASGVAIALAATVGGWLITHRPNPSAPSAQVVSPVANAISASTPPIAESPSSEPSAAHQASPAPEPSAAPEVPRTVTPHTSVPKPVASAEKPATPVAKPPAMAPTGSPMKDGFADPIGLGLNGTSAVMTKVQDRQVRLFSRVVANESNVADAVVRKAIDHYPWGYLRCYDRTVGGAKDLPEGVVTVSFDILDQLPRHGKLEGSTIANDPFNACVVSTLLGQTINAAGPDGKGRVVYAFRFKVMD
ncbi:serine/threonine protein kinase [Pendulispora albinea]|uniref:Protein kinase n=1 Tax=Pendulispora albinea TaxID=2741071 RepID=A0ABZ2LWX2_9BACT